MESYWRPRANFLWHAIRRPLPKWLLIGWGILSFWDTLSAQLLPDSWSRSVPRIYDAVESVSGFLPWWAWVIIGLSLVTIFVIEFAVRPRSRTLPILQRAPQLATQPNLPRDEGSGPDYTVLALRRVLRIEEAACLMAGVWPVPSELPKTAFTYSTLLCEWVEQNHLARDDSPQDALSQTQIALGMKKAPNANRNTGISLRQLLDHLEAKGIAADFVSEMRKHGVARRPSEQPDTRKSLATRYSIEELHALRGLFRVGTHNQ